MAKLFIVVLAVALPATNAAAQQYPVKPIRMIASQAPGGGIDTLCRIVGPKLAEAFSQTVVVENRARDYVIDRVRAELAAMVLEFRPAQT